MNHASQIRMTKRLAARLSVVRHSNFGFLSLFDIRHSSLNDSGSWSQCTAARLRRLSMNPEDRGSNRPSTPAVIPQRAGRAVFEVFAAMPDRSNQHAQMLAQRIKMSLPRGGHEWMPVENHHLLFPFPRQPLKAVAEFKFFRGVKLLAEPAHFAEHVCVTKHE